MPVEGRLHQVDSAHRSDADSECRQCRGNGAEIGFRSLEKKQPVVSDFSERAAQLDRPIPDAAIVARSEARSMCEWRIPERGEKEIMNSSVRHVRRLRVVDQLLEQHLLFG